MQGLGRLEKERRIWFSCREPVTGEDGREITADAEGIHEQVDILPWGRGGHPLHPTSLLQLIEQTDGARHGTYQFPCMLAKDLLFVSGYAG
jgi:hypothetical protein